MDSSTSLSGPFHNYGHVSVRGEPVEPRTGTSPFDRLRANGFVRVFAKRCTKFPFGSPGVRLATMSKIAELLKRRDVVGRQPSRSPGANRPASRCTLADSLSHNTATTPRQGGSCWRVPAGLPWPVTPPSLVLRFINSATYSPEFPFALSLSKCGRSWFDGLTTTGYGYVVVFTNNRT